MRAVELLIDGHHGVYTPQAFAQMIDPGLLEGVSQEDLEILKQGPEIDNENYWETWAQILDGAQVKVDGKAYYLYQDCDLWMYCQEKMTEEEKRNLFGYV